MNHFPGKADIRSRLRAARAALSPAYRRKAAAAASRLAIRCRVLLRQGRFAFYFPRGSEFDLLPMFNRALWMGKACYTPVLSHRGCKRLGFSRLGKTARPYLNRFGITEVWSHEGVLKASQVQTMFVPLLGFDREGNRIGMGGGYYDATLAFLSRRRAWRRPYLVGVAYECQKLDHLPRDPWDVPMDAVLTEQRIYRFRRT
jgi:5-formyltetrahydrofolate cyclo-ligase